MVKRLVLGLDEAGRGAVLGPMVIAVVAIEEEREHLLREIGVKDSKKLSPKRREELFYKIQEIAYTKAYIISAREIDERVFYALSIDELELSKISESLYSSLKELSSLYGYFLAEIYIDAPGGYANRIEYAKRVIESKLSSLGVSYIVYIEPKADEKIPVVSAASIVAKVVRDREIERLKRYVGEDFGSGYPSDPKTIGFLERVLSSDTPEYVRSSRATTKRLKKAKNSFLDDMLERVFKINMNILAYLPYNVPRRA